MDLAALRRRIQGHVVARGEPGFEDLAFGTLWNRRHPTDRTPDVIVRVAGDADVAEAVRAARAGGLRVTVRGGGHNWCSPSLREGGMLVDLTDLTQVLEVDADARTAVTEPVVSNRDMQALLNAQGLAYPTGHCPEVKLSGYLLGGGMSWNACGWGEGYTGVEAIDLVTADGELVTASATEHPDLFWAARGAGSTFFAVAVRFHLRLQTLPAAMRATSAFFALADAEPVAGWLQELAPALPANVELTHFMLQAPPEVAGGKVCLVTATAFTDSEEEARHALAPLQDCAVAAPLAAEPPAPTDFPALFDLSGSMWPPDLRATVDAMYFDAGVAEPVAAIREHVARFPEDLTVVLFAIPTGPPTPAPDAAFSHHGRLYGGPWTMWREPADDAEQLAWHARCVDLLLPLAAGHYIGESDTMGRPDFAERAFSPEHRARLAELRRRYDPDGLFSV